MTTLEVVLATLIIVLLVILVIVGVVLIVAIRRLMWTLAKFTVIAEVVDRLTEKVANAIRNKN